MNRILLTVAALTASLLLPTLATATTPQEQLAAYVQASGTRPDPLAGQTFFSAKHGRDWSCSTCHTATPTVTGKHATTSKSIAPLAPVADAARFTDGAKTEKWFRRNCNDVVGRECTVTEKANVLAWLLSLKA